MRPALAAVALANVGEARRAVLSSSAVPQNLESCYAVGGSFESAAARMAVFPPNIFVSAAHTTTQAVGNITEATDCFCSGFFTFPDKSVYNFKYDVFTCDLTWTRDVEVMYGPSQQVNVWHQDRLCNRPPQCDPSRDKTAIKDGIAMETSGKAFAMVQEALDVVFSATKEVKVAAEAYVTVDPGNFRAQKIVGDTRRAQVPLHEASDICLSAAKLLNGTSNETETEPAAPEPVSLLELLTGPEALLQRGRNTHRATRVAVRNKIRSKVGTRDEIQTGCAAMAGSFEHQTAIVERHSASIIISSPSGPIHAQGEITEEERCLCSGDVAYSTGEEYHFKYSLATCTMTWFHAPTVQNPHPTIANKWALDGYCHTVQACDPSLRLPHKKTLDAKSLARRAQEAAFFVADAAGPIGSGGAVIAFLVKMHGSRFPDSRDTLDKASETALGALEKVKGAVQTALDAVAMVNPLGCERLSNALLMIQHNEKPLN
mmetsp:Transcript_13453/g.33742  ORF Transcript_13453/g.33742 Transcript_13453/m.33742 type:complete len:487 (+) Transcript_13453:74-1534(+)